MDKYVDNLWIKFYPQVIHTLIHKLSTFFLYFINNIDNLKSYPLIHIDDSIWNILILNFITGFLWITLLNRA